jgi:hypothetical protein
MRSTRPPSRQQSSRWSRGCAPLLQVSKSGFYEWRYRPVSDTQADWGFCGPLTDRRRRAAPGHGGGDSECKHPGQQVAHPASVAWVGQLSPGLPTVVRDVSGSYRQAASGKIACGCDIGFGWMASNLHPSPLVTSTTADTPITR